MENDSIENIDLRGIRQRQNNGYRKEFLEIAVRTPDPQSNSDKTHVDDDSLIGEIPITNADIPCVEHLLSAEFISTLGSMICAYYPVNESWVATLTWDAASDEWECSRRELERYSFAPEDVCHHEGESILWRRVGNH